MCTVHNIDRKMLRGDIARNGNQGCSQSFFAHRDQEEARSKFSNCRDSLHSSIKYCKQFSQKFTVFRQNQMRISKPQGNCAPGSSRLRTPNLNVSLFNATMKYQTHTFLKSYKSLLGKSVKFSLC